MFRSLINFFPTDFIWSLFPQIVRPMIDQFVEKDLTQEDRVQIQKYIDICQKANTVFSWVLEELENLLHGRPVDMAKIEKLRKWEIPESQR